MAFSDVEMSILAQLSSKDIDVDGKAKKLSEVLEDNKTWLKRKMGSSYEGYIDRLIQKVDGSDYEIVASEHDKISGFAAYAVSTPENEVVVACRGTQMDDEDTAWEKLQDIATDGALGVSPTETWQHRDMQEFVDGLEEKGYDGYYFTGHSLGGNLAIHGATTVEDTDKVKGVYTYNSPGFNEAYWIAHGWKLREIKNIKNYQNEYDYVSSVLRVPGEVVIVKSNVDGSHAAFDDHFLSSFTIDENGYFQKNEDGKKKPQTYAGAVFGEMGNSVLFVQYPIFAITSLLDRKKSPVYVKRDFSQAAKERLLGMVSQVENEKWGEFTDWVGDRWYDFESWIGTLDIGHYINDVNAYHKKVIDKNNTSADKVKKIFDKVWGIDSAYGTTFDNLESNLAEWLRFIKTLTGIVEPGKGRFNGQYISGTCDEVLQAISKANVQRMKDQFVQNIGGELIFDEDLILEFIKKDPGQMTDDEQQALLEVIEDLQDTITFYETAWSLGDDQFGADFLNVAGWLAEDTAYASFSAVSAHYNDIYVNVLDAMLELGEDSNTFAAALLKAGKGDNELSVLGLEASRRVSQIFGSNSVSAYIAKWKTDHSETYYGKLEAEESLKLGSKNGIKPLEKWVEDKLEQNKLRREDDDPTEYYDKEGNRITQKDGKYYDKDGKEVDMPTFYEKEYTIAEISAEAKASVSIYDKTWTSENASANITVGEAEAHAQIAGGFYVIGADGEKKFSPGVNAEVGASVTVFEATGEAQLVGDEMLGVNVDGKVTLGKAEAKAEVGAQVFGEDGKLDVQLGASASAELIGAEAEASVGVNVLGGEVAGKVGVNVGIGAHADVGYRDGKLKFDVGASVGVGFSVDVEVDIGGMVDTVCDVAESAWDTVKDGWNNFWSW